MFLYLSGDIQKGVDIGLRLLSLETCLQVWPVANLWELGFQKGSQHFLIAKSGSLHLNCLCEQCGSCWISAFLLGIWNFGVWWQRMPMWPAPIKTGHWISNELPRYTIVHTCCHNSIVEELRASYVTPQGAWAWFPQALYHVLFFLLQ